MGLQIRRKSMVKLRFATILVAAFALVAQPMYGIMANYVANATGVTTIYSQSGTHPIAGGNNWALLAGDTSNYHDLNLSFDYNAESLENGESLDYAWATDASQGSVHSINSISGHNEDSSDSNSASDETGTISVALPTMAATASLYIDFFNHGSGGSDNTDITNLKITGTENISTPTGEFTNSAAEYWNTSSYKGINVDVRIKSVSQLTALSIATNRTSGGSVVKTAKQSLIDTINAVNGAAKSYTAPVVVVPGSYNEAGSGSWNAPVGAVWNQSTVPTNVVLTMTFADGSTKTQTLNINTNSVAYADIAPVAYTETAPPTMPSISGNVIYNSISSPLPASYPSEGFEATGTSALGDKVTFAGNDRKLDKAAVVLTSWACENGNWTNGCVTTPGATFNQNVTLNLYNVASDGSVGSVIKSITKTFAIPYRPTADPTCSTNTNWRDTSDICHSAYNYTAVFDINDVTVPNDVYYSVAFNTSHYGVSPIGSAGPADSLNVGLNGDASAPYVGVAGTNVYQVATHQDDFTGYHVAAQFTAQPTDTTPPSVPTATLKDANDKSITNGYINTENFKFNLSTPSGDNSTKYQVKYWNNIDGDQFQGKSHAWTTSTGANGVYADHFSRGEGTHYFAFSACDAAGNCSAYSAPFKVVYDKTAPDNGSLTLTGGKVVNGVRYVRPGDTLKYKVSASDKTSGLKYASYIVFSMNGQHQNATICGNWPINSSTAQSFGTSSEISGIFTMKDCNGGTKPSDGTYAIGFRVYDNAGNNLRIANEPFIVDGNGPTVSDFRIDNANTADIYAKTVKVSATASDNYIVNNVKFYVAAPRASDGKCDGNGTHLIDADGQLNNGRYEASLNTSSLNEKYCVYAIAEDEATNHGAIAGRQLVAFDNIDPSLKVNINRNNAPAVKSYLTSGAVSGPNQKPEIEAFDTNLARISVFKQDGTTEVTHWDSVSQGTTTFKGIGWLGEGTYILRAYDTAGNVSSDFTITIDKTKPTIEGLSLDKTLTNGNTIILSGKINDDNLSDYQVRVQTPAHANVDPFIGASGTVNTDGTLANLNVSGLQSGNYVVRVWATDKVGNSTGNDGITTYYLPFTIDRSAPAVPTIRSVDGSTIHGKEVITVAPGDSDSTIKTVTLTADSGQTVNYTSNDNVYTVDTTTLAKNTQLTIHAVAKDVAGNTSSKDMTYTVDNGNPTINDPVSLNGDTDGNFTLSGGSSVGGATVTVTRNGSTQPYTAQTDSNGNWSVAVGQLSASTRYRFNVTLSTVLGYSATSSYSRTTPAVETETVVSAARTRLFSPFTAAVTPTNVSTTTPKTSDKSVLGTQSDKSGKSGVLGDSTVTHNSPWKIFGFAWYWWLLLLAAIAAVWWLLAARRRAATDNA